MASKTLHPTPARSPMNKKARATFAKETINILIPKILQSNQRARDGARSSELIRFDPSFASKQAPLHRSPAASKPSLGPLQGGSSSTTQEQPAVPLITSSPGTHPLIKILKSDSFDAALAIRSSLSTFSHQHDNTASSNLKTKNSSKSTPRIAVLNMASSLRPGGGVLNGALAQEESLCVRSTLLASLPEHYYRLPSDGAIYSPDVLVFRDSQNRDLPKIEWFFVDVISCAALKAPDTVVRSLAGGGMEKAYADEGLREEMRGRVRTLLQVAQRKGVNRLVLGAWGCGAYGNPPPEVAQIFRGEILGTRKRKGVTVEGSGIEEIVFAIFDEGENLRAFREAFKDVDGSARDDVSDGSGNGKGETIDGGKGMEVEQT